MNRSLFCFAFLFIRQDVRRDDLIQTVSELVLFRMIRVAVTLNK